MTNDLKKLRQQAFELVAEERALRVLRQVYENRMKRAGAFAPHLSRRLDCVQFLESSS